MPKKNCKDFHNFYRYLCTLIIGIIAPRNRVEKRKYQRHHATTTQIEFSAYPTFSSRASFVFINPKFNSASMCCHL